MTTPIIMLVLMMAPYLVVRVLSAVMHRDFGARGAAAIGLGVLFLFTAIVHFIRTELMSQMLPPWVPERVLLVYLTGVLEFSIAIGFLVPKTRRFAGWVAAVVLVFFSSKYIRRDQPYPDGRSRVGSRVSFPSSPTSGHHLVLGVLVYHQAA